MEKTLIKGRTNNVLQTLCGALFVAGALLTIYGCAKLQHVNNVNKVIDNYNHLSTVSDYIPMKSREAFIFIIIGGIALALFAIVSFFFSRNNEIVVTEKRVYGIAGFGKRVDIPLDSISSIGMAFYKSVIVASSSGRIVFCGLSNAEEIHMVMSELIVNRQYSASADEAFQLDETELLRKYKKLLDDGMISDEEYSNKKKQILNL